ncbi:SMP-30/gluconolactonase/LRE family protein [Leptobacterium flavescens]|uniref:SMP-30/gluconolactonase/LRE family protein n=1 Tax=Leptobacterium flavescens TaxID=472055 RepID=A0A6P0UIL9_9FLAO|nr:SMP-30/gluconolactonase/LRE family protein [Leptobacterium flavescens]NER12837.1 SMP-30/gluconolactonase/LRE family protein [Leptobacterium flavescens]
MKYTTTIIAISILCLSSCKPGRESSDFTEESVFTDGIEGPATDYLGNIYAVNFREQGTIGKVTAKGESSLFINLPEGSIGNGIRFGKRDQMFIADYTNHNILEVDLKTKKIGVFAHQPAANQPNDLAIAPDKTIYASDPNWEDHTGNLWKVTREKGFELLEEKMGTTNGIEVSPDGKKLYVNESIQQKIWVYDITEDGSVKNKSLFHSFQDFGLDGMRCDREGNLFVCRYDKGTIVVLSPEGELLKEFMLKGKRPTNITFSNDYKSCYITVADRGCIEVIRIGSI